MLITTTVTRILMASKVLLLAPKPTWHLAVSVVAMIVCYLKCVSCWSKAITLRQPDSQTGFKSIKTVEFSYS